MQSLAHVAASQSSSKYVGGRSRGSGTVTPGIVNLKQGGSDNEQVWQCLLARPCSSMCKECLAAVSDS